MSPLDAALLVMILALPLFWLVLRELDRLDDPAERIEPRELFLEPGLVYVTD